MNNHPELEQLSAYADGELDASELAHLTEHLPGCSECSRMFDALRATISDIGMLPEPVLDHASIAAIDARVAAERAMRRSLVRRWGVVSGAAAAVLVALLVFGGVVRQGTQPERQRPVSGGVESGEGALALDSSTTDYTEESLAQALTGFGVTGATQFSAPGSQTEARSAYGATGNSSEADLARCSQSVETANADVSQVRAENARFKGQPAFVLFYLRPRDNPTYAEVWVLRPSDCYTLYYAQSRL